MTQQPATELDLELSRLDSEYRRRDSAGYPDERYGLFDEATLLHSECLERNLLALLKRHNFTDLAGRRILEVGCGSGDLLRRFLEYGAFPTNLSGIDLMAHRIELARSLHPGIDWQVGSAHQLPYPDDSFDLVMSFALFSSILSESLRQEIAKEMWRVRKPGGLILLHDFMYPNPRNPAVRGITRQRIRKLFNRPGAAFDFRRIVLAPPISRTVAAHAWWLASTLEQLKIVNTHTIGIISLD
ncbi:MAG TPA: class I SAM-dependent methyltransferase [Ktedonobacteraceae bacterium]